MRVEHFRYLFNTVNGFYLKEHIIMFRKPVEIWNEVTGESIIFKSVDEALEHEIDGEKVRDIIERTEILAIPHPDGGRGAGSGNQRSFKFSHARNDGTDNSTHLHPAYANTRIKAKTLEGAMAEFRERYKNANSEWAYEVDDQGYVHQYVKGNRTSVAIGGSNTSRNRSTMILHNHPSGGAFSDSDLLSTAMDKHSKGIVASGKKYDYIFKKGTHFKANEFAKAVKNATLKGKDYDDAVDKWLKKNAKKYGYQYSRRKN